MPDIAADWALIRCWLGAHLPATLADLRPGACADDIAAFEAAVGSAMPDGWRQLYRMSDGQAHDRSRGAAGVWFGLGFLPLQRALRQWRSWRDIAAAADGSDETLRETYMSDAASFPAGAIRSTYASSGWIPMAEDWGGNHFGIDLAPGPDGRRGQVINFGRDEDLKVVMAPNLKAFIVWMAEELDQGGGKTVADGKGKIDFELADPPGLHFLDAAKARFGPAK